MSAESDAYTSAALDLANAVADAANDPADAIRLLIPLAGWMPPTIPGRGPLAAAARTAQDAIAATLRGAACAALGAAARSYRPVSYQDAQAVRIAVCGALDAEAIRAADAGRDATYAALRELRAAVALDLALRGANLSALVEITTRQSTPSLAEAWALYQDTTREPELVAAADAASPLFFPLDFTALTR